MRPMTIKHVYIDVPSIVALGVFAVYMLAPLLT